MTTLLLPAPSNTPPPATAPAEDLASMFHSLNSMSIGSEGLFEAQAIGKRFDGTLDVFTLPFEPTNGLAACYAILSAYFKTHWPVEIVFGMDRRYFGEGTDFGCLLSVHHYQYGRGWRFGVIDYEAGERTVSPIVWGGERERWLRTETLRYFTQNLGHLVLGGSR